jgi:hypothetical protein
MAIATRDYCRWRSAMILSPNREVLPFLFDGYNDPRPFSINNSLSIQESGFGSFPGRDGLMLESSQGSIREAYADDSSDCQSNSCPSADNIEFILVGRPSWGKLDNLHLGLFGCALVLVISGGLNCLP